MFQLHIRIVLRNPVTAWLHSHEYCFLADGRLCFCGDSSRFNHCHIDNGSTHPRLWKRYVDDTFCILRKGSTEELLHHLNGVRPTIKFMVEQEDDGTLPFLDTLLRRREDGSLDVSVYRKPTHTDRYLHFESHYLTHVERSGEMSP